MKSKQRKRIERALHKIRVAYLMDKGHWQSDPDIVDDILKSAFSNIDSVIYDFEFIHNYTSEITKFMVWRKAILQRKYPIRICKEMLLLTINSIKSYLHIEDNRNTVDFQVSKAYLKRVQQSLSDLKIRIQGALLDDMNYGFLRYALSDIESIQNNLEGEVLRNTAETLFNKDKMLDFESALSDADDTVLEVIRKSLIYSINVLIDEIEQACTIEK